MNRIVTMVLKNLWIVPGAWFKLCRYAKHTDEYPEEEKYRHIQYILQRAVRGGNVDMTVTGQENIPTEGGFMLYANHQGMFDVLAIAATCHRPIGAVLKKELYDIPFLHQIVLCTKSFAMDREDVRQSLAVIQNVTEEVKKGRGYLIFPEGTRSKRGNEMLPFHGGSFRCATKSKCPIVPIALIDCFKVLDQKGSKPVSVQIHYLKPIPYEEYAGMKPAEVAELVKARIAEKIQECI
ncbi:MAG TPA: 1-acyl-sn-glycerol-3-phosphate acyltransferase [Candidatus Faecousia faecavium]|nr:1-acyl-sn-glycerol-3-phosphate acyltransferase [Candidatus Faecousia faecavium]